jgi:hypothetical protein
MPLLKPKPKIEQVNITARVSRETALLLDRYAEFLNRPRSEILDILIAVSLGKEKEFQAWLQSHAGSQSQEAAGNTAD